MAAAALAAPASGFAASAEAGEFVGPLAGWLDAKRDFGAVGDGRADDTAALSRALAALQSEGGTASALYLPIGVYRITGTLTVPRKRAREAIGLSIQGEDARGVTLLWDGPAGGVMLHYAAWYSRLGRLVLDGAGRAGVGIRCGPEFITANEIADVTFQNMRTGIEAGDPDAQGTAETSFLRCRFLNCGDYGMRSLNFNSLDLWFWHCQFQNCGVGLSNVGGAGNFHAYHCLFRDSGVADITMRNTGYLSFRDNVSIGSKAFFVATPVDAAAQLTFQRNRIIDSGDQATIRIGNLGPVLMLDNVIASRDRGLGPAVSAPNAQFASFGNRFTVPDPIATRAGGIHVDDRTVARERLNLSTPAAPAPARRYTGRIIEVAAGSDAAAIQRAIDQAAAGPGPGVVHLADAVYPIDRSLVLPAGRDIRLVGERRPNRTRLVWEGPGAGPVLRLTAPSRATIEDLSIQGGKTADGLLVEGVERGSGSIWIDQVMATTSTTGFLLDRLRGATPRLRNIDHAGCDIGMHVIGLGASSPVARAVVLSGSSSNNKTSYRITNGARLLARDIWYESGEQRGFMRLDDSGEFTLNGSNIAIGREPRNPAVQISGFRGRASFLGVCFTGIPESLPQIMISDSRPDTQVFLLGCHGHGEWLEAGAVGAGRTARLASVQYTPGGGARPIADRGSADRAWMLEMLEAARDPADGAPPRVSIGPKLVRLFFANCRTAVHLRAT